MNDSGQKALFNVDEYTKTSIIGDIDDANEWNEDPKYITPPIRIHENLEPEDYLDKAIAVVPENLDEVAAKVEGAVWSLRMATCFEMGDDVVIARLPRLIEACRNFLIIADSSSHENSRGAAIAQPKSPLKTFDNRQLAVIEAKPEESSDGGLNRYKCKGSNNHYWRYTYKHNGCTKHLHIKGGNERAPLVKRRVATIQKMIADGGDHWAIAKIIKSW